MSKIMNEQAATFFTPWQIYLASCLGSPLAAAWLLARNHRALHHPEEGRRAVWVGIAATLVILAIALLLPSSASVAAFPFLYSVGWYWYARQSFGADIAIQLTTTGQRGAWWRVTLMSLGIAFMLSCVLSALALVFPGLFASKP